MADHVRVRAARWICAAVALVACAWFAIGIRQAVDTSRATAIANQGTHATAAQVREVSSLRRGARLFNPDKQPDVLLGQIEVEHGDFASARRVLTAVTRSEPQNIAPWLWLARASASDPTLFYVAAFHVHALEPHVPAP
jgi:cytochrome c-type biogenesis protein CcmH/NrfG